MTTRHDPPLAVALGLPATRMVALHAWWARDKGVWTPHSETLAVVAVRTAAHASGSVRDEAIVAAREGLVQASLLGMGDAESVRVVACPWPAAEDGEHLAAAVTAVLVEAARKAGLERTPKEGASR